MMLDSAIIGGGPAGLNAALVLGRARRNVIVFDDNQPRNAVTQESHGFLTRDGVKPREFREIAHQEISRYPSVAFRQSHITDVQDHGDWFELVANDGAMFQARTVILATGLKEVLPAIEGIHDYYGKSLFNCPYCDGWELRDQPLILIYEDPRAAFHMAKTVWNWSRDLLLCTNGHSILTDEQKATLQKKEIRVIEEKITALVGSNGQLERVVFASQEESRRSGGFVGMQLLQASTFGAQLGCDMNAMGGVVTDELGRTSVKGVYAAGEASVVMPAQLIHAASGGSRAAAGVNAELTEREFA